MRYMQIYSLLCSASYARSTLQAVPWGNVPGGSSTTAVPCTMKYMPGRGEDGGALITDTLHVKRYSYNIRPLCIQSTTQQ